jgi:prepilin-type processing-associated H-X9-DG protein
MTGSPAAGLKDPVSAVWNAGGSNSWANDEDYERACDASTSWQWDFRGEMWYWGGHGGGGRGGGLGLSKRPNHKSCDAGNWVFDFTFPPSSRHPGSVNVLMADGGVHSISDSIDGTIYRALGTRNGQEQVDYGIAGF